MDTIRVELEIRRPDGHENVSSSELIEWIEYELGVSGSIKLENPLSDGTPLSEGIVNHYIG